jgi:hypothetical protein
MASLGGETSGSSISSEDGVEDRQTDQAAKEELQNEEEEEEEVEDVFEEDEEEVADLSDSVEEEYDLSVEEEYENSSAVEEEEEDEQGGGAAGEEDSDNDVVVIDSTTSQKSSRNSPKPPRGHAALVALRGADHAKPAARNGDTPAVTSSLSTGAFANAAILPSASPEASPRRELKEAACNTTGSVVNSVLGGLLGPIATDDLVRRATHAALEVRQRGAFAGAARSAASRMPSSHAVELVHGEYVADALQALVDVLGSHHFASVSDVRFASAAQAPIEAPSSSHEPHQLPPSTADLLCRLADAVSALGKLRDEEAAAGGVTAALGKSVAANIRLGRMDATNRVDELVSVLGSMGKALQDVVSSTTAHLPRLSQWQADVSSSSASPSASQLRYTKCLESQVDALNAELAKTIGRAEHAEASNLRLRNARRFDVPADAQHPHQGGGGAVPTVTGFHSTSGQTHAALGTAASVRAAVDRAHLSATVTELRGQLARAAGDLVELRQRLSRSEAALGLARAAAAGGEEHSAAPDVARSIPATTTRLADLAAFRDGRLVADALQPVFGWTAHVLSRGAVKFTRPGGYPDVTVTLRYDNGRPVVERVVEPLGWRADELPERMATVAAAPPIAAPSLPNDDDVAATEEEEAEARPPQQQHNTHTTSVEAPAEATDAAATEEVQVRSPSMTAGEEAERMGKRSRTSSRDRGSAVGSGNEFELEQAAPAQPSAEETGSASPAKQTTPSRAGSASGAVASAAETTPDRTATEQRSSIGASVPVANEQAASAADAPVAAVGDDDDDNERVAVFHHPPRASSNASGSNSEEEAASSRSSSVTVRSGVEEAQVADEESEHTGEEKEEEEAPEFKGGSNANGDQEDQDDEGDEDDGNGADLFSSSMFGSS